MEDELGMNLFLGDEFHEENEQDNLDNPNDHIQDDELENDNINDEPIEGKNPEGVDGDDTEDENDADEKTDVNSSPPLYKSLASVLHEQGVLTSVDSSKLEKVETIQDLADLIVDEVKSKELADLTDLQKEAVEAFRAGVDVETFQRHKQTENQLDNITEDDLIANEDLRKQIIYQDFINQGFSEAKAERLTNRSFDADDDIEDAKEALENIKSGLKERFAQEIEYNKTKQLEAEKAYKEKQEKLEKTILNTEEPFAGIKVNETLRKNILNTMMKPVGKNPITGVEENALMKDQRENENFSQRLYTVYTLTKGFTDFSYFGKTERSKATAELEKALKNNLHTIQGGDPSFLDDPNSSDYDIGDTIILR